MMLQMKTLFILISIFYINAIFPAKQWLKIQAKVLFILLDEIMYMTYM